MLDLGAHYNRKTTKAGTSAKRAAIIVIQGALCVADPRNGRVELVDGDPVPEGDTALFSEPARVAYGGLAAAGAPPAAIGDSGERAGEELPVAGDSGELIPPSGLSSGELAGAASGEPAGAAAGETSLPGAGASGEPDAAFSAAPGVGTAVATAGTPAA